MKCNEFTIDNCTWYPDTRILIASGAPWREWMTPDKSIVIGKTRTVEFTELRRLDYPNLRDRIIALLKTMNDDKGRRSWWFYNKELNIVLVVFQDTPSK
jgi:hypothetical protein